MPEIVPDAAGWSLGNAGSRKHWSLTEEGFVCDSVLNPVSGHDYCHRPFPEFHFLADGAEPGPVRHAELRDGKLVLTFAVPLAVTLECHADPGRSGILQTLHIANTGTRPVRLTHVEIMGLVCAPESFSACRYYSGSDRHELPPCFSEERTGDLVYCHHPGWNEGWAAGSFVPGILRHTFFYPNWNSACFGYSRGGMPFEKMLAPGETWHCDPAFFALYCGDLDTAARTAAATARLALPEMAAPGVMYCTWLPFLKNIDETLLFDLIRSAAEIGAKYFVLDDGWFTAEDRAVDRTKFPHGLEAVADRVHQAGLKFGLWNSIGSSYGLRNADPAWFCRLENGDVKLNGQYPAFCFGSGYREWIAEHLTGLASRYSVDYFKLDFSCISSPYDFMPWGCHAHNHAFHRGYGDSAGAMYEGMAELRRKLKAAFPQLVTDFSFETFGPDRPSFAGLRAGELQHVSNLSGNLPEFQSLLQIRRTYGRWFAGYPAERILGGLLVLREGNAEEVLLTSFAGAPLVAGDLRELSPEIRKRLREYTEDFAAFSRAEPAADFELLADEPEWDAFVRQGASGKARLVCAFNRSDAVRSAGGLEVPPHSCRAMLFSREA